VINPSPQWDNPLVPPSLSSHCSLTRGCTASAKVHMKRKRQPRPTSVYPAVRTRLANQSGLSSDSSSYYWNWPNDSPSFGRSCFPLKGHPKIRHPAQTTKVNPPLEHDAVQVWNRDRISYQSTFVPVPDLASPLSPRGRGFQRNGICVFCAAGQARSVRPRLAAWDS
jgi:hypothetical protein